MTYETDKPGDRRQGKTVELAYDPGSTLRNDKGETVKLGKALIGSGDVVAYQVTIASGQIVHMTEADIAAWEEGPPEEPAKPSRPGRPGHELPGKPVRPGNALPGAPARPGQELPETSEKPDQELPETPPAKPGAPPTKPGQPAQPK